MYQQPEINKQKSLTIKSLMNNQGLRQNLIDGLKSPPGSTKRKRASSLLKSLASATQNRMDGMGGSGSLVMPPLVNFAQQMPQQIGQIGSSGTMLTQTNSNSGALTIRGGSTGPNYNPFGATAPAPTTPYGTTMPGTTGTPQFSGSVSGINIPKLSNVAPATTPTVTQPAAQQQQQTQPPAVDPSTPAPGSSITFAPTISDLMSNALFNKPAAQLTSAESAQGTALSRWASLSGGPNSAALSAMGNAKLFSQLTGIPEEAAPKGASLAGQLNELYTTLKSQYSLDTQENNLRNMQKTGVVLESDLNAYVKGKDEYLRTVNSMLDKAKQIMYTQDTSNPYTQAAMSQYVDYLNILKGRQEVRYADLVKSSVDQYNAEIQFTLDKLNSDKTNFLQDYQNKATITTEDFNNTKDFLMEMYNNLSTLEEKSYQKTILQNEALMSEYNAAAAIAGLTGNTTTDDYIKNRTSYDALMKPYLKTIDVGNTSAGNATKVSMVNGDINEMMSFAQNQVIDADGNRLNPGNVLKSIVNNINQAVPLMLESGKAGDALANYKSMINSYFDSNYNNTSGLDDTQKASVQQQAVANAYALAQPLISQLVQGFGTQINSDPQKVTAIIEAIKDLVGQGGWFSKPRVADKDAWEKDHSSIDKVILDSIYNNLALGQMANMQKPQDAFLSFLDSSGNRIQLKNLNELTPTNIYSLIKDGIEYEFINILSKYGA